MDILKADYQRYFDLLPPRYGWFQRMIFVMQCQGLWAITDYRFRKWLVKQPVWLRVPLVWIHLPFHILIECLTGISIPTGCQIGKGLYIGHFSGIFLYDEVILGRNCSLSQGVTIGLGGKGEKLGAPQIGDNVYFGPGAKVFGKITIGNNVRIGANAVVLDPVPDGATAVGIPARIIQKT